MTDKKHSLKRYDSENQEEEENKDESESKTSRERIMSAVRDILITIVKVLLPFLITTTCAKKA